jgi:glucokinase
MGLTVGVDVGGTKIAAGVVDEQGTIVATSRRESPASDSEAVEATIAELVLELKKGHAIEAVGVGAAGFVDVRRSTVLFAPNIAWRDEPLKAELERLTDLPVVVENDANAAAWGEFAFGCGKDVDDLLLVTVGTGVGGGIVLDGQLHRGAFGVAAEIGHLRVVPNGRPCGCGNLGCWEQYASGSALVRDAQERVAAGGADVAGLLERAGGRVEGLNGPIVTEAAQAGDPVAIELLTEVGRWLGEGIASLTAVLDPAVVAIGGGVSEAGDLLLEPIREHFRANLTARAYRPELSIRPAELGNKAGLIGAADLARHD